MIALSVYISCPTWVGTRFSSHDTSTGRTKVIECPRRRLRAAAGRKTLFGSSEPDVTLADGCCYG